MRQDPRMLKPYIMVGHRSDKGFNTSLVQPKPHMERRCNMGIYKDSVNYGRINRERMRVRMQRARFVPASLLVRKDGTRKASLHSVKKAA